MFIQYNDRFVNIKLITDFVVSESGKAIHFYIEKTCVATFSFGGDVTRFEDAVKEIKNNINVIKL